MVLYGLVGLLLVVGGLDCCEQFDLCLWVVIRVWLFRDGCYGILFFDTLFVALMVEFLICITNRIVCSITVFGGCRSRVGFNAYLSFVFVVCW